MAACEEQTAHASVRSPATLTPRVRRQPRYELTRRPVLRSIPRPTGSGAHADRQECQSARPGGAASLVAGWSANPGCWALVAGAGVMRGAGWRYDHNDVRPHHPRRTEHRHNRAGRCCKMEASRPAGSWQRAGTNIKPVDFRYDRGIGGGQVSLLLRRPGRKPAAPASEPPRPRSCGPVAFSAGGEQASRSRVMAKTAIIGEVPKWKAHTKAPRASGSGTGNSFRCRSIGSFSEYL